MKKTLVLMILAGLIWFGAPVSTKAQSCDSSNALWNQCAADCISKDPDCNVGTGGPCNSQLQALRKCQDGNTSDAEQGEIDAVLNEAIDLSDPNNPANAGIGGTSIGGSSSAGSSGGNAGGQAGTNTGPGVPLIQPPNRLKYDGKPIFDGPGLIGGATIVEGGIDGNISQERNLKELIIGWTNFLLSISAILAVVALVWAGFLYITAFGDDSRMETAKKIVIWVVLGILLILASYAIVNTVMRAVF